MFSSAPSSGLTSSSPSSSNTGQNMSLVSSSSRCRPATSDDCPQGRRFPHPQSEGFLSMFTLPSTFANPHKRTVAPSGATVSNHIEFLFIQQHIRPLQHLRRQVRHLRTAVKHRPLGQHHVQFLFHRQLAHHLPHGVGNVLPQFQVLTVQVGLNLLRTGAKLRQVLGKRRLSFL